MHVGELGESLEDYLEIILQLEQEKGEARAKEIAQRKDVRMASVTGALKRLAAEGLIDYRARETAVLTPSGRELANRVLQRHEFITRFLNEILGVPLDTASREACSIEHIISIETLDRLAGFVEFLGGCPRAGGDLVERFHDCYAASRREQDGEAGALMACRTRACTEAFGPEVVGLFARGRELTTLDRLAPGPARPRGQRARGHGDPPAPAGPGPAARRRGGHAGRGAAGRSHRHQDQGLPPVAAQGRGGHHRRGAALDAHVG